MSLEKLHCFLVLLRIFFRVERSQISALAGLWIFLA